MIERNDLFQIMFQMWPNINHYAQDMIKTVVEPKLQETLANYKVTGFQFDKLRLGTIVSFNYLYGIHVCIA